MSIDAAGQYKAGERPPVRFLDWMEWAAVQHRAGLRQRRCAECGLYRYPQEMADGGRKCRECLGRYDAAKGGES